MIMKKYACIFIAALLVFSAAVMPGCSSKVTTESKTISVVTPTESQLKDEHGVGYTVLDDGSLTVEDVNPTGDTVEIPETFNGKSVKAIGRSAFKMCEVKKVVIPDTITEVPDYAFAFCKELEEVILPDTVQKIGNNAFCGCSSLKSLDLPENLGQIGVFSFDASALEEIVIPEKVASIGEYAFAQCSELKSVVFSGKYTEVGENCFNETKGVRIKAPKGSPIIENAEKLGVTII